MTAPVRQPAVTMTAEAKDELCRTHSAVMAVRRAEIAATLRFAENIAVAPGYGAIRISVTPRVVADRLCKDLFDLFGHQSTIHAVPADAIRPYPTYLVDTGAAASDIARQIGLLDRVGEPVLGLPAAVMGGDAAVAAAVWRGAFLAAGTLDEPGRGRAAVLEIACPNIQSALALIAAARRCAVKATHKERRRQIHVLITDPPSIVAILTAMGAPDVGAIWGERWQRWQERLVAIHGANYTEANVRRAARAGVIVSARARRALEILGDSAPEHLSEAGRLRVENQQASLDELGQCYDPPLSKDAMAGRIRRLLALADRVAHDIGVPDTASVVSDDLATSDATGFADDYDGVQSRR